MTEASGHKPMRQWDTFDCAFPHGVHPCVIFSRTARCENPAFPTVNVLACSTQRTNRPPRDNEIILDVDDGMDWPTLVRLDFIWVAKKEDLLRKRGHIGPERLRALGQKLIRWFGLWQP